VIDRLLKSQAAQPVKETLEEIPRPAKITNLQHDMGLANDKKVYSQCRVSFFSSFHFWLQSDKYDSPLFATL
jgi:hypothetical protein